MSSQNEGARQKRIVEIDDESIGFETPVPRRTRARLNFSEGKSSGERVVDNGNIEEIVKEVDLALINSGETSIKNRSIGSRRKYPTIFSYSDLDLHEILSHAPAGEEEMLREMRFDQSLYQGMTGVFRGAYSFILVVDKLRKIVVDCRQKRMDIEELEKKVLGLQTDLEKEKMKSSEFMEKSADIHARNYYIEVENAKLHKDLERSRKYAGELRDVVEAYSGQVTYAHGKYKDTEEYRKTLEDEFCQGFEVCKEQVAERYKDLDMKWLADAVAYIKTKESGGTSSAVKDGSSTEGLDNTEELPKI